MRKRFEYLANKHALDRRTDQAVNSRLLVPRQKMHGPKSAAAKIRTVSNLLTGGASPQQTTDNTWMVSFVRQDYCASDLDIVGIIDQAYEKLFQLVLTNPNHVIYKVSYY